MDSKLSVLDIKVNMLEMYRKDFVEKSTKTLMEIWQMCDTNEDDATLDEVRAEMYDLLDNTLGPLERLRQQLHAQFEDK